MKVLVAGATGGVGQRVVWRLRQLGIPARALTRVRARASFLEPAEIVEGNSLVAKDCARAVSTCDAVVCTLGDRMPPKDRPIVDGDGIINLIEAAQDAGVPRFILVSSLGVDDSWQWMPFPVKALFRVLRAVPILEAKARSERHLRLSKLSWIILRPGFLINCRMRAEPLLVSQDGMVAGISGRDGVADVCVRCLHTLGALRRTLTVVNRAVRGTLRRGHEYPLDVPWGPWQSRR